MSSISLSEKEALYLESPEFQQPSLSARLEHSSFSQQESLCERKIEQLTDLQNSKKISVYKSISWMFYVAAIVLGVVSLLIPAIYPSLWYMPLVGGLVGGSILFLISGLTWLGATSREKRIEEARIACDLLQERRSPFIVGEADRDVPDERLSSDRESQLSLRGGKRSSKSTHSIAQRCDKFDLAAAVKAKEIIANHFAGRDSIYSEERWKGFIDRAKEGKKENVDSTLGFGPITGPDRFKSDLEKRKYYLPTFCKEYFAENVKELGEEVQKLYGSLDFLADAKTRLHEFEAATRMMANSDKSKIDGKSIEDISYDEAREVLSRLKKCRADLADLKSNHYSNYVENIEGIISKSRKSYTKQSLPKEKEIIDRIEKVLKQKKKRIESLKDKAVSVEEKTEGYEKYEEELRKCDEFMRVLENKLIGRKTSYASTAKDILQARLIREERGAVIPTNPALWSRHITELKLDNSLKKVDNKVWWGTVSKVMGPQVLLSIPLLLAATVFASNPWWLFAAFCGELTVLPMGYFIGLYASNMEKEKRALKMYRDPEPRDPELDPKGKGTPIVQMFDPEFKQIPATRPVLRDLQRVTQERGLDGMRPTASRFMVEEPSAEKLKTKENCKKYLKQLAQKRALVEKKTEDISQVYVGCLKEQKTQLARLQKRSLQTFVTTRRDLSPLAHRIATSASSLDEKMATLDEAMQKAKTDEERHEIQMLRGILSVEKQLAQVSPDEEKATRVRKLTLSVHELMCQKECAEKELALLEYDIELKEMSRVQANEQPSRTIELLKEIANLVKNITGLKKQVDNLPLTPIEKRLLKSEASTQAAKEHLSRVRDERYPSVRDYNAAFMSYKDLLVEEGTLRNEQERDLEDVESSHVVVLQAIKKVWKREQENQQEISELQEISPALTQYVLQLKKAVDDGQKLYDNAKSEQIISEESSLTEKSFQFLQQARAQLAQCQNSNNVEEFETQLRNLAPDEEYLQNQWEWMIKQLCGVEQKKLQFLSNVSLWEGEIEKQPDVKQKWQEYFSSYRELYQRFFDGLADLQFFSAHMALRVHKKGVEICEASVELKNASDQLPKQKMID